MSETIGEKSLRLALGYAGLRDLPPQYKEGDGWWVKALLLVRKRGLSESWCIAERDVRGVVRIIKDFGLVYQVVGILSVHPYEYLDYGTFGAEYKDAAEEREALIRFYRSRMGGQLLGLSEGDDAYKRAAAFGEGRIKSVQSCSEEELAVYDRERIRILMRENPPSSPYGMRPGAVASSSGTLAVVQPDMSPGEAFELLQKSRSRVRAKVGPSRTPRKRGRPPKDKS